MDINKLILKEIRSISENKKTEKPIDYEKKIIESISKMRKNVRDLKETFVDYGLDPKCDECEKLEDIYEILLGYEPVRKKITPKRKTLKQVKEIGEYKSFKPKRRRQMQEDDAKLQVDSERLKSDRDFMKNVNAIGDEIETPIELT